MSNNYIMGRNTLKEVILHRPESIIEVYVNLNETAKQRKDELIELVLENKIPLKKVTKNQLFSFVESDSHQSFVAKMKNRNFIDLKSFFKAKEEEDKSIVLMLDNISDPHNMGAILRSSECFGVDGVVYSKNRGTDITPVVSKVSCGATELLPLIRISNLAQTAKEFQKNGYEVLVAENREDAVNLSDFTFADKTLIVMGAEGFGVQRLIKELADRSIKIPLYGHIDSLNVAQATSVILAIARFK